MRSEKNEGLVEKSILNHFFFIDRRDNNKEALEFKINGRQQVLVETPRKKWTGLYATDVKLLYIQKLLSTPVHMRQVFFKCDGRSWDLPTALCNMSADNCLTCTWRITQPDLDRVNYIKGILKNGSRKSIYRNQNQYICCTWKSLLCTGLQRNSAPKLFERCLASGIQNIREIKYGILSFQFEKLNRAN